MHQFRYHKYPPNSITAEHKEKRKEKSKFPGVPLVLSARPLRQNLAEVAAYPEAARPEAEYMGQLPQAAKQPCAGGRNTRA